MEHRIMLNSCMLMLSVVETTLNYHKNIYHHNMTFLALANITFLFHRPETHSTAVHKAHLCVN